MDSHFDDLSSFIHHFDYDGHSPSSAPNQSASHGGDGDSSSSDPVIKYINDILMEEDVDDQVWVYPGALAHTERSLYHALGQRYPYSPNQPQRFDISQFFEDPCPSSNLSGRYGISSNTDPSTGAATLTRTNSNGSEYPHLSGDHSQALGSAVPTPGHVPPSSFDYSSQLHADPLSNSSAPEKNILSDNDFVTQFKRSIEEANKFLRPSTQLVISFEDGSLVSKAKDKTLGLAGCDDKRGREDILSGSRDYPGRDHELEEWRGSKQSATSIETEEAVLTVMLDKVLLSMSPYSDSSSQLTSAEEVSYIRAPVNGSSGGMGQRSRQVNKSMVDSRALLILCAQAMSSNDLKTANMLLKQIRENSSPSGDGTQRLAHYFANALDARMAVIREEAQNLCYSLYYLTKSVPDVLKADSLHMLSCPFKKLSILYMNYMIWNMSQKASVLHIIDFGIAFGFHWPILIQMLGSQPGGPPKLRITGIEFPLPGFRPAERIEETCKRLARYCKRFHVPFEFNALPSRNWETIRVEDFKIRSGEMIAVNCLSRFNTLLDEMFEDDCPRDAVLRLIRKIKPDVFAHTISNGSYNAPFFVTRFKEALFHLSSIYDMFEATLTGELSNSRERTILEGQYYAREIMNVVACEGTDRIQRPETYKQWQIRHVRAGFKQLPLHKEIMKKIRYKLESCYHKDFVLDEDGSWMLLGWKGRIMYGTTCCVPA